MDLLRIFHYLRLSFAFMTSDGYSNNVEYRNSQWYCRVSADESAGTWWSFSGSLKGGYLCTQLFHCSINSSSAHPKCHLPGPTRTGYALTDSGVETTFIFSRQAGTWDFAAFVAQYRKGSRPSSVILSPACRPWQETNHPTMIQPWFCIGKCYVSSQSGLVAQIGLILLWSMARNLRSFHLLLMKANEDEFP
jgi:hypothetical protein